jgi:hypothetical protein
MKTIQKLAKEYLNYFDQKEGKNGLSTYTWKDEAPQELRELIQKAHGNMLPNDYRYNFVVESLEAIAEDREDSIEADIYNRDLLNWLSSHLDRSAYCDQYVEEYGGIDTKNFNIINVISGGQYLEKLEVYHSVLHSLEEIIEELEDEELDDEEDSDEEE